MTTFCNGTFVVEPHGLIDREASLIDDEWSLDNSDGLGEQGTEGSRRSGSTSGNDEQPPLSFLWSIGGRKWEFHRHDRDFFPSIPHGHKNGRDQPKLDPYQGWVYQRSKQIYRIKKAEVARIWNDEKFRALAHSAITFYAAEFPHYRWRVPNPFRLPRKRQ
jgi:hypothetical protein